MAPASPQSQPLLDHRALGPHSQRARRSLKRWAKYWWPPTSRARPRSQAGIHAEGVYASAGRIIGQSGTHNVGGSPGPTRFRIWLPILPAEQDHQLLFVVFTAFRRVSRILSSPFRAARESHEP